jgi:hypothetical protein
MRDWVAEDDLVHFIISAVERLPPSTFAINHKGCGEAQYPPHAMRQAKVDVPLARAQRAPGAGERAAGAIGRHVA